MRLIFGITLLLIGTGMWLCQIDGLAARSPVVADSTIPWVRTVDGWERTAAWEAPAPSPPRLHPLVVAAGQLLVSLFALAAASPERPPKRCQHRRQVAMTSASRARN